MTCILFFVRLPEIGKVKTRLAAELGEQAALRLYRAFVRDQLAMFQELEVQVLVVGTPAQGLDELRAWLGPDLLYLPQRGKDLGERMACAFADAFARGYDRALCIGSDLPDLPHGHLTQALAALKTNDAVLGPAADGGYWCIGFWAEAFTPEIFSGIVWSGPGVFAATMARMVEAGLTAKCLPSWMDVDTVKDLAALRKRNLNPDSRTRRVLDDLAPKAADPGRE